VIPIGMAGSPEPDPKSKTILGLFSMMEASVMLSFM